MPKGIYTREQGKPRPWRRKLSEVFTCQQCLTNFPNKDGKFRKFCSYLCKSAYQIGKLSKRIGYKTSEDTKEKNRRQMLIRISRGWKPNTNGLLEYRNFKKGLDSVSLKEILLRIRNLKKMTVWRNGVFEKANYLCSKCGTKSNLHAHHDYLLREIVKEEGITTLKQAEECERLWDIENGVCFCSECHKARHREYEEVLHSLRDLVEQGKVRRTVEIIKGRSVVFFQGI